MTKLFEEAIAQARRLPEEKQDELAEALFAHMAGSDVRVSLTDEQVLEVARRRQELRDGTAGLASDEEMDALWKKCGL